MGFHFEPTIVWPHRAFREPAEEDFLPGPPPVLVPHEMRVWRAHESLRLGHTTRVEKLDIPHIAEGIGPHARAVICFTSVIVHGIFDKLEKVFAGKESPKELVAPPFLLYDRWDPRSLESQLDALQHYHPGAPGALDLGPRRGIPHSEQRAEPFPWPDERAMAEHNRNLLLGIDHLVEHMQARHFILDPPVLWASMKEVDTWFAKAAGSRGPQWRHAHAHQDSAAQYSAWRSWVGQLVSTEAHMLFVFPNY